MGFYRKKPVVIEAVQVTEEWFSCGHPNPMHLASIIVDPIAKTIAIPTLEGTMTAQIGDWIIRGIKGEYYPCKPDIFEATYEPVELAGTDHETAQFLKNRKDFEDEAVGL